MADGMPIHYAPLASGSDSMGQHAIQRGFARVYQNGSELAGSTSGLAVSMESPKSSDAHEQAVPVSAEPVRDVYVQHSSGQRINTDIVISEKLRLHHKDLALVVVPAGSTDLLAYASAGHATAIPQEEHQSGPGLSYSWRQYSPPARRVTSSPGSVSQKLFFGKFIYRWTPADGQDEHEFILYIVDGRDGGEGCPITNQYILTAPGKQHIVDELIIANGLWLREVRDEIWVFDSGRWRKSAELWNSVKNASWKDVILDERMKAGIRADVEGFFDARETYRKLKVPWKRGIIFYGPPGNGKTISIKAMMHTLYERKGDCIPTLYVRSLKSMHGGEYCISAIFATARQQAPCYLVFEDLDSLVTDQLRSYFLNEVDGLNSNDGIFMLGSTNHFERLDPGISKRPSRFDRKYLFPNPDAAQREAYCHFWQGKLAENRDIEFPDELRVAIAGITEGFSFAYVQEAFVASLLAIARKQQSPAHDGAGNDGEHDALDKYVLWVEMKKQVEALREGLEGADSKKPANQP